MKIYKSHRLPLALAAAFAFALPLAAQNINIQERTLKNGMKVLVREDPSIPNVALYTFFRV